MDAQDAVQRTANLLEAFAPIFKKEMEGTTEEECLVVSLHLGAIFIATCVKVLDADLNSILIEFLKLLEHELEAGHE